MYIFSRNTNAYSEKDKTSTSSFRIERPLVVKKYNTGCPISGVSILNVKLFNGKSPWQR